MDPKMLRAQLEAEFRARQQAGGREEQAAYDSFNATELYCPKCKRAMPVREKQLLVLSDGDLVDFVCTQCGTSLGTRKG